MFYCETSSSKRTVCISIDTMKPRRNISVFCNLNPIEIFNLLNNCAHLIFHKIPLTHGLHCRLMQKHNLDYVLLFLIEFKHEIKIKITVTIVTISLASQSKQIYQQMISKLNIFTNYIPISIAPINPVLRLRLILNRTHLMSQDS